MNLNLRALAQPGVCPTCHVVRPATCRNERGQKVWPPHWQRATVIETRGGAA